MDYSSLVKLNSLYIAFVNGSIIGELSFNKFELDTGLTIQSINCKISLDKMDSLKNVFQMLGIQYLYELKDKMFLMKIDGDNLILYDPFNLQYFNQTVLRLK